MITINETLYKKMPDDIKLCFEQLPNPSAEEVRECFPNESERFFKSILYYPKASKKDRGVGNTHPTVKSKALCEYLIKMITPKGGIVLDPFTGSGSTLVAAKDNGFQYIGIELTEDYLPIIQARTGCEIVKEKQEPKDEIIHNDITGSDYVVKNKKIVGIKDTCSCGGKIIKLKSGGRCCEACMRDY